MAEKNIQINQPSKGMNRDLSPFSQEDDKSYSLAINANIESEDGEFLTITNEPSNSLQTDFGDLNVIGRRYITELNKTIIFSVNTKNNKSEIGEIIYTNNCKDNFEEKPEEPIVHCNECEEKKVVYKNPTLEEPVLKSTKECNTYRTLVTADCLNFNINFPIHEIEYKLTNKEFILYWTDNFNVMRHVDLKNIPYIENTTDLDCNKIKVFPDFKIPCLEILSIENDGQLEAGSYQYVVAYANGKGEELSQYYSPTNPVPIWENKITNLHSFPTTKSVNLQVSDIDTSFKFINIAVIKTINYTQSFELVGTFDIYSEVLKASHTGNNKQPRILSENDIFYRRPFYTKAGTLASQNNILMWGDLESSDTLNYQKIANQISLKWISTRLLYNDEEGYNKLINSNKYRGYLRDEVYSFYIAFLKKNGEITHKFHIPGPSLDGVNTNTVTNSDGLAYSQNTKCDTLENPKEYEVYNTATGFFLNVNNVDPCEPVINAYGDFGHYISELKYPNNSQIWGPLAGQNIRHHRFPDTGISPIFDVIGPNTFINVLGVQLEESVVRSAINNSDLSQEEKDEIVGFYLLRDTRATNESIVAKGLLYNVGQYVKDGEIEFFPNYPYNDLNPDPFISSVKPKNHSGSNDGDPTPTLDIRKVYRNDQTVAVNSFYQHIGLLPNSEVGDFEDDEIYKCQVNVHFASVIKRFTFEFVCYKYKEDDEDVYEFRFLQSDEMYEFTAGNRYMEHNIYCGPNTRYIEFYLGLGMKKPNRDLGTIIALAFEVDYQNSEVFFTKDLSIEAPGYPDVGTIGIVTDAGWANPINVTYYKLSNFKYSTTISFNDIVTKMYNRYQKNQLIILEDIISYIPSSGDIRLNAFVNKDRFTFHGPNIHFFKPGLGSLLKLESVYSGKSKGLFTYVEDESKYAIATPFSIKVATSMALSTVIRTNLGAGTFGWPTISLSLDSLAPTFLQALDMFEKLIPLRQYALQYLSVGEYNINDYIGVNNQRGNIIRALDKAVYLGTSLHAIGDIGNINNHQRESSVYLKTNGVLPYPHEITGVPRDNSRFTLGSYFKETNKVLKLNEKVERNISSFYASIRRIVKDQYGELHSNRVVSLGDCNRFSNTGDNVYNIQGGDTFINKFALKRKLPFFLDNRVGFPDKSDVTYDLLNNIGHPTYWLSTFPIEMELSSDTINRADALLKEVMNFRKAGNLIKNFTTGGAAGMVRFINFSLAIGQDIIKTLGVKNINLDMSTGTSRIIHEEGYFYLFSYGIPYFFVESDINLDLRQAENPLERNFFPNVSKDIPKWWLQEKNVSIEHDNYYFYNRDFSKQNLENFISHLPKDFDPIKDRKNDYPTRVIYSRMSNFEEKQDNWLVYNANNYYDFSLTNGKLISLSSLEQGKVLVRFENNFSVYNAFIQLPTDNKTAITGAGDMFATPPQEYSNADIGYAGTQNKAIQKTKFGYLWVDVKRGNVLNLNIGQGLSELSRKGMKNWFRENLPFNILKDFPDYNIDNSYHNIGIATTFDNKMDRYFVTKRDWLLKTEYKGKVGYNSETHEFFISEKIVNGILQTGLYEVIQLGDPTYFINKSWTIGYNFQTEGWVSYYSFKPNYYIEKIETFESGINSFNEHSVDSGYTNSLWVHGNTNKSFQTFYNTLYLFKVETFQNSLVDDNLSAVQVFLEAKRYVNDYDFKIMPYIFFNKALIYNNEQASGDIELTVNNKKDLRSGLFSKTDNTKITVGVEKDKMSWKLNKFFNAVKDLNSLEPVVLNNSSNTDINVNPNVINYSKVNSPFSRSRIANKDAKVQLVNDKHQRYKFVYRFTVKK